MSTRKGTAVFLTDIIREASNVMHEQMQKNEDKYAQIVDPARTSQEIGVTGIKIQDMQAKRRVRRSVQPKRSSYGYAGSTTTTSVGIE